jgi:hypothetical protein
MDFVSNYNKYKLPDEDENKEDTEASNENEDSEVSEGDSNNKKELKRRIEEFEIADFRYKWVGLILFFLVLIGVFLYLINMLSPEKNEVSWVYAKNNELISRQEKLIVSLGDINLDKMSTQDSEFGECIDPLNIVQVTNIDTGEVLYSFNEKEDVPVASLNKLVTAIIAYQYYDPEELLTVVEDRNYYSSEVGLKEGEYMRAEDLIKALLIFSANDAGYILADNYKGGYESFIKDMNEYKDDLNLKDSQFINPVGLDELTQHSTVGDVTIITKAFSEIQHLYTISAQDKIELRVFNVNSEEVRKVNPRVENNYLENRHPLVTKDIANAGKTGYTQDAGFCLLSIVEKGNSKYSVVVLRSSNRGEVSKCLINKL